MLWKYFSTKRQTRLISFDTTIESFLQIFTKTLWRILGKLGHVAVFESGVGNAPFLNLRKPLQYLRTLVRIERRFREFFLLWWVQESFKRNVTKILADTRASQSHDKFHKSFLMKRNSEEESLHNFITQEHNRIEEENFGKSHEHKKIYICRRPMRRSTKKERNKMSM